MDYLERLQVLQILRKSKFEEYQKALCKYIEPQHNAITFKEVSDLKEELDDIYNMITATENAFYSAS